MSILSEEGSDFDWNEALDTMLDFLEVILPRLPPLELHVDEYREQIETVSTAATPLRPRSDPKARCVQIATCGTWAASRDGWAGVARGGG